MVKKRKNKRKKRTLKYYPELGNIMGGAVTIITGARLTGAVAKAI